MTFNEFTDTRRSKQPCVSDDIRGQRPHRAPRPQLERKSAWKAELRAHQELIKQRGEPQKGTCRGGTFLFR